MKIYPRLETTTAHSTGGFRSNLRDLFTDSSWGPQYPYQHNRTMGMDQGEIMEQGCHYNLIHLGNRLAMLYYLHRKNTRRPRKE